MLCTPTRTTAASRLSLPPAFFHLDPSAPTSPLFAKNRSDVLAWQSAIARKQYCATCLGGQGRFHAKILAAPPGQRRCAVVGSSATLLGAALGSEIDGADFVLRVNSAPTAGFEADVGRRTSLRIVTLLPFRHLRYCSHVTEGERRRQCGGQTADAPMVVYCNTPWRGACWSDIADDPVPRASPAIVERTRALAKLRAAVFPSSGLLAVMMALSLCEAVSAYGFGTTATQRCAHYFGDGKGCVAPAAYTGRRDLANASSARRGKGRPQGGWHNFRREEEFLRSLARRGAIRLCGSATAAFEDLRGLFESTPKRVERSPSEFGRHTRRAGT